MWQPRIHEYLALFDEAEAAVKDDATLLERVRVARMPLVYAKSFPRNGYKIDDVALFIPHQANLRVNEAVVQHAGIPPDKVLNTLQMYGNTTAATVPLTIDHWRRAGRVKKGDRILFGKYSGSDIKLDGVEHLILREDEVLGILDDAR